VSTIGLSFYFEKERALLFRRAKDIFDLAPTLMKQIFLGVIIWRLAGVVLTRQTLAERARSLAFLGAFVVGCLNYVPLYSSQRRGLALLKVIACAFAAYGLLFLFELCLGDDAAAAFVCLAFFTKPDLASLSHKLRKHSETIVAVGLDKKIIKKPDNSLGPLRPLRSRDLGIALLATNLDEKYTHRTTALYLGVAGNWFVATRQALPMGDLDLLDPYFARL